MIMINSPKALLLPSFFITEFFELKLFSIMLSFLSPSVVFKKRLLDPALRLASCADRVDCESNNKQ